MSLCRCGSARRQHEVTDACLSPADQEYVRRFKAAYDMAELGPWWLQAAGRDESQDPVSDAPVAQLAQSAPPSSGGGA